MADIPDDNTTSSVITGTGQYDGELETNRDEDWWKVTLKAGYQYDFKLTGDGGSNDLRNGSIELLTFAGQRVTGVGEGSWLTFRPTADGVYFLNALDSSLYNGLPEGNYIIHARMDDNVLDNAATTAAISGSGKITGSLGQSRDSDWYRITLKDGLSYGFTVTGDGGTFSLDQAYLHLRDANGNSLKNVGDGSQLSYRIQNAGTYFVEVVDGGWYDGQAEGNFVLTSVMTDNVRNDRLTTAVLRDGHTISGRTDVIGDQDWYAFQAVAGRTYTFSMARTGDNAGGSQVLILRDADGQQIKYDTSTTTAAFSWTASSTGRVYLDAGPANYSSFTGNYGLSVVSDTRTLTGTSGNDRITGGAVANVIDGLAGNDMLFGGSGNDTLIGGSGNDTLNGGAGSDTALFTGRTAARVDLNKTGAQNTGYGLDTLASIENVTSGSGHDILVGNSAANILNGGAGNDTLKGGSGNDTLEGGSGNDLLDGGSGRDTAVFTGKAAATVSLAITGTQNTGYGRDKLINIENLTGGSGHDKLTGNKSANVLIGNDGNDILKGGAGNDRLEGGKGNDVLDGGTGSDWAVFTTRANITVNLTKTGAQKTGEGNDRLISIENIETGSGHDKLTGNAGTNHLIAGAGNDVLIGGAGNDRLNGGDGADRLTGGKGNDVLIGGAGADVFVFGRGDGRDRITDFQDNVDLIRVTGGFDFDDVTIGASGRDTVIRFGGTTVILDKVSSWSIGESDFDFA